MKRAGDLACLLLTGALSLLVACIYFRCFSLTALKEPWYTFQDVPLMQTYIKVAAEGEAIPWKPRMVSRLNAPFRAYWSDFPTPEELLWDGLALLQLALGVTAGYNAAILLGHLLVGCSFYLAARVLGSARAPAVFCAVCLSAARFIFARDAIHINLSYCWHVPWFWVTANWFWLQRPLGIKARIGILLLCAITAWQNPYYWFFWLLMLVPCWLVPLARRQFRAALPALIATGLSTFFVFLAQIDSLLGWIAYGHGHPYNRSLNELLLYGLRLSELVLPLGHHWVAFDQWAYLNYYIPMAGHTGEVDSSYLGLIGIATLFYVVLLGTVRLFRREPVPFVFGMSVWLAIVMVSGGLAMLAGSFGFLLFRCTGRSSIVLQIGLMLFLALRLTRWRFFEGKKLLLVIPLLAFNTWDCLPPYLEDRDQAAQYVANQQATVAYLEKNLPPRSMIFQWPLMEYPEAARLYNLHPYEQLMAYLFSKNLRFSHGNCSYRPESQWQYQLAGKDPESIRKELQRYGFRALWLYSNGLSLSDRELWQKWKRQPDFRSPQGDLWIYNLQPLAQPELPKPEPCRKLSPAFYGLEEDRRLGLRYRWVWGKAGIDLLLPSPCPYRFRFGLTSFGSPRTITLLLDGKLYDRVQIPAQYGVYRQLELDLSRLTAGDHRLELVPDGPALPRLDGGRRLTFQYINESLEPLAGP